MMNFKKNKILELVGYIFVSLSGFIFILIIISLIPLPGNYKVFSVMSGSMEPTIKTGSIVFVKPSSDYKVDDIISFSESGNINQSTTHRIIEIIQSDGRIFYKVKGDANDAADWRETPKENVIGKVLFSIPLLGYLLTFAKQPLGFVILVWIPAIIIIWEEVGKIRKELKTAPKTSINSTIKAVQTKTNPSNSSKVNLDIKQKEEKTENKKSRSGKTIKKPREKKNPPKKI